MRDVERKPSEESSRRQEKALRGQKLEEKALNKKERWKNKEYTFVSSFFVVIFLSLIGYLIYFDGAKSQEFINSPYNTRQDTFADRVIRGNIVSSDGKVLAYTEVHEDGSEKRVYPYSRIFSHVVGYDSNGKSGLESEANFQLLSSHSFFLNQLKNQFRGEKNMGDTVVSTLDYTVQNMAYQALGNRRGAIIAIEPSTGKILAEVSNPDFDPNTIEADWEYYVNDSESSNLLNRVTNGQYPPGSTFKTVVALDYFRTKGTLNKFSFRCQGTITREEHTIRCYGGTVHDVEDFYAAFANSCNTAFAYIGLELGGKSLRKTSEELLFNHKLPYASAEKSTFSLNEDSPIPLIMQTSIGQGNTLVSPLHMALITCSIANHGVLMKPYLIDSVVNDEGQVVSRNKAEVYKRLMTNNEANLLSKLMTGVVDNGTASALAGRAYTVAGKTGSAEFDESGASHSWFIGYCNVNNPDLVVAILVENGGTGSQAAVPIAGQIFDAYYTSLASQKTDEPKVDYSNYEEESNPQQSGWFDIIEEDYQEFEGGDLPDIEEEWGVDTGEIPVPTVPGEIEPPIEEFPEELFPDQEPPDIIDPEEWDNPPEEDWETEVTPSPDRPDESPPEEEPDPDGEWQEEASPDDESSEGGQSTEQGDLWGEDSGDAYVEPETYEDEFPIYTEDSEIYD